MGARLQSLTAKDLQPELKTARVKCVIPTLFTRFGWKYPQIKYLFNLINQSKARHQWSMVVVVLLRGHVWLPVELVPLYLLPPPRGGGYVFVGI